MCSIPNTSHAAKLETQILKELFQQKLSLQIFVSFSE